MLRQSYCAILLLKVKNYYSRELKNDTNNVAY
jgi:hypothetical protein